MVNPAFLRRPAIFCCAVGNDVACSTKRSLTCVSQDNIMETFHWTSIYVQCGCLHLGDFLEVRSS